MCVHKHYSLLFDPLWSAGPLLVESLLLEQLNISVKFFEATIRWLAATASKYAWLISFGAAGCGVSITGIVFTTGNDVNVGNDEAIDIVCSWNGLNDCECWAIELNAPDCLNSSAISRRRSRSISFSRSTLSLSSRSRSYLSSRRCLLRSVLELRLLVRLRLLRCFRSLLLLRLLFFDLWEKKKSKKLDTERWQRNSIWLPSGS